MADDDARLLTDRAYLETVQYRTDANLAARQSIYQFQHPGLDLPAAVLDLAGLAGTETVADVGCGNGRYLAELARRQHTGRFVGVDLSAGMLAAARASAAAAGLVAGDAAALPLADGTAGVTLAMHMLYHVPDRPAAVRELRRVTTGGGQVLVVLNGPGHLAELRSLVAAAAQDAGLPPESAWAPNLVADGGFNLDNGADLLAGSFRTVQRHDFITELAVPGPGPVPDYIRSMRVTQSLADPELLVAAAARGCERPGMLSSGSGPARAAWSAADTGARPGRPECDDGAYEIQHLARSVRSAMG
jgi:SAM-dependent methyltransferase